MKPKESLFGHVVGVDPRLTEDPDGVGALSLRRRNDDALTFFTTDGRMVSLVTPARGRGPDYVILDRLPEASKSLPTIGWSIVAGNLNIPGNEVLNLLEAPAQPSEMLSEVRDYPGHLRSSLNRALRRINRTLESPLNELSRSLKEAQAEAVEKPVLALVGSGAGILPDGDMALCGFLLAGRACETGNRLRADWHGRLAMEIRRFLHRTTSFAAAWLRFALEGRTTVKQERLFDAMARDVETVADAAVDELLSDPALPGPPFLAGVASALDLVHADMEQPGVSRFRTS